MGKASTRAQNRYIAKAYDRINLTVPKGRQETIKAHAEKNGKSVNGYINSLIQADMGLSDYQWKGLEIVAEVVVGKSKELPIVFQKLANDYSNYCVQYAGNGKYFVEFEKAADYLYERWNIHVREDIFYPCVP